MVDDAVLGLTGWLGLFVYPATSRFRAVLLAWLIAFVAIGVTNVEKRGGRSHPRRVWQLQADDKRIELRWNVSATNSSSGPRADAN